MAEREFMTTDLSDAHADLSTGTESQDFGGRLRFHGPAKTLLTFEDNTKLRAAVEQAGNGQVLVVDGGGSMNCALFGVILPNRRRKMAGPVSLFMAACATAPNWPLKQMALRRWPAIRRKAKSATLALTMSALIFRAWPSTTATGLRR